MNVWWNRGVYFVPRLYNFPPIREAGVLPEKSQNAVLQLYSTIFIFAVSKLKPKQYKLS